MDTSLVAGTLSMVANKGLCFAKFLGRLDFVSNHCISASDSITEQTPQSSTAGFLQLSAALFPVATIAPPPVKSVSSRSASRTFLRRKRRMKKRRLHSDDSQDGEDDGSGGDDFDGSYGGGNGGGGRGWNFDGFGGHDWDESSSSSSPSNPAYYFVYEVVCWIALSNCVHFAFKKVVRFAADSIGNSDRGKFSMRLISVC